MKWEDFRQSENIEDRRGSDYAESGGGGFGGSSGHLGLGAMVVLGIIGYALGIDPRVLIGGAEMASQMASGGAQHQSAAPRGQMGAPKDRIGQFVAAILAENEDVWKDVLPQQANVRFVPAPVVLFNGQTRSGCGRAQSAMGPFYCPEDKKIYLDTSFFREMKQRFGGGGDFAYAYVIAHEMGHHIQDQLGTLSKWQAAQQSSSKVDANAISVRIELQADCLAGVWAANANQKWQVIEPGDVEKAVATAQAIGDDKLQEAAQGRVVPDSFTHGSAAQRVKWLQRGLQSGKISSCNTFN
ncbi:putative metalloprotease [Rhodoblastus acidophilus]|uniref:KPN_02809 family neutral zinc metallopeptidase n=1 Tax=Rhodoblastus acidophilus TaxID=1074 RepID=UPI0022251971|nr:neutral zinc metallopeptidase [Rhodoblastus acidophilus]MCW2315669.1 putative metalloprotease [Rhodoblastus acidophilus]